MRKVLLTLLGAFAVAALSPAIASAAPPVTNTGDSGTGSLRAAIAGAVPGDTVIVPAGTYAPITTLFPPVALTLQGAGASSTIIDGATAGRILFAAHPLTVSGITFRHAHLAFTGAVANAGGAAIQQTSGTLTISPERHPDDQPRAAP